METKTLRLILGDQLNGNHSWFESRTCFYNKSKKQEIEHVLLTACIGIL